MKFRQNSFDWKTRVRKEKVFDARLCNLTDFGHHKGAKKFWDAWEGFTLVCPDIKYGDIHI